MVNYLIRSGSDYIAYDGRNYTRTSDCAKAIRFDNRAKAERVRCSSLCSALKKNSEIAVENIDDVLVDGVDTIEDRTIEETKKENLSHELLYWVNRVQSFRQTIYDANQRMEILVEELSIADRKVSDVLHKIELHKDMNVPSGYAEYRFLRELLRERRAIKNEYEIAKVVANIDVEDCFRTLVDSISKINNRIYTPRELPWIFEEGCEYIVNKKAD